MKANVGGIDRTLRIAVGASLISWAALGGPAWAYVGVVPLLTGVFSFCGLYSLLGINTCSVRR